MLPIFSKKKHFNFWQSTLDSVKISLSIDFLNFFSDKNLFFNYFCILGKQKTLFFENNYSYSFLNFSSVERNYSFFDKTSVILKKQFLHASGTFFNFFNQFSDKIIFFKKIKSILSNHAVLKKSSWTNILKKSLTSNNIFNLLNFFLNKKKNILIKFIKKYFNKFY